MPPLICESIPSFAIASVDTEALRFNRSFFCVNGSLLVLPYVKFLFNIGYWQITHDLRIVIFSAALFLHAESKTHCSVNFHFAVEYLQSSHYIRK